MQPRRGLSITEVLIGIFLMAIGMISLLALFPIGILRMADSIRSNRVAAAAGNAQSLLELHRLRDTVNNPWIEVAIQNIPGLYVPGPTPGSGAYLFEEDPTATMPVYIDPIGAHLWFNPATQSADPVAAGHPVGATVNLGIPRAFTSRCPPGTHRSLLYRWHTLEDEMTFLASGVPTANPLADPVERQRRISWAYLWRRPVWQDRAVADVSVVVYSGRQIAGLPRPGGSAQVEIRSGGPAGAFAGTPWNGRCFIAGSRLAAVAWGSPGNAQALRPGYWVLDATVLRIPQANGGARWLTNGFFYRVVNVLSEPDAQGQQLIELDRPARADGYVAVFPLAVVDVIEKSDGRRPY